MASRNIFSAKLGLFVHLNYLHRTYITRSNLMKARLSLYLSALLLLTILAAAVGCSKAPTDAQIASDIQNKLNTDSGLQGK